jgi:hypothetical protein
MHMVCPVGALSSTDLMPIVNHMCAWDNDC